MDQPVGIETVFGPGAALATAGGGGLYMTGEEGLQLTTIGALAGAVVMLEGRLITPDGKVIPIAERHVPNSNYTAKSTLTALAEGVLVNVQLRVTTGTAIRGHVFALLEIARGSVGAVQPLGTLLQGYLTSGARLAWPGSLLESSTAGAGRIRSITGTDPAAGVEISETVPAGVRWRVLSFWFTLVTSAVVANRTPRIVVDDGALEYFRAGAGATQAASLTQIYDGSPAPPIANTGGGPIMIGLPYQQVLMAGHRIKTSTALIDAGDNYSAPQYVVEEWIEG